MYGALLLVQSCLLHSQFTHMTRVCDVHAHTHTRITHTHTHTRQNPKDSLLLHALDCICPNLSFSHNHPNSHIQRHRYTYMHTLAPRSSRQHGFSYCCVSATLHVWPLLLSPMHTACWSSSDSQEGQYLSYEPTVLSCFGS